MQFGAITGYVDVAQLVLYAFWAFFFGLIYYLVRENHREGYPMDSGRADGPVITGWPTPAPKTFKLGNGHEVTVPDPTRDRRPLALDQLYGTSGSPLTPTGNPMVDGVGPASWAEREDEPDRALNGTPVILPLRATPDYSVAVQDTDPRNLIVYGTDGEAGGTVTDIWLDRIEMIVRYLEVRTTGGRNVLLPVPFCRIKGGADPHVMVKAITGGQFEQVPGLRNPDLVTKLEEEKVVAYYGGGTLYATAERSEPLF